MARKQAGGDTPDTPARRARRTPGSAGRERTGILIGRQDLGEADRILRWIIPEEGRVSLVAKGARRPRNPFAQADIGVRARLWIQEAPRELPKLQRIEIEEERPRIRDDWSRTLALLHLSEVFSALVREGQPDPRMFGLLETALLLLDNMPAPPGAAFLPVIEAKALTFAGLTPGLSACSQCPEPLDPDDLCWDGAGLVHPHCASGAHVQRVPAAWAGAVESGRRSLLKDWYDQPLAGDPALLTRAIEVQMGVRISALKMMGAQGG